MIAAPMFLVSGPKLVIATAKAGIAAAFPAPNARAIADLDQWMGEINAALAQADVPWALNIVAHKSYERLKDELALIVRHKPPLVITA
ncbi:MAG: nitronate monooxygenase, partial [Alphaproteobacteria bacterium]|nr:nitronate monooxygenase [Alphaproteobacteria bacterium]